MPVPKILLDYYYSAKKMEVERLLAWKVGDNLEMYDVWRNC